MQDFNPKLDPERPEYQRVHLKYGESGIRAQTTGNQISSRLNSFVGADGLLILPPMEVNASLIQTKLNITEPSKPINKPRQNNETFSGPCTKPRGYVFEIPSSQPALSCRFGQHNVLNPTKDKPKLFGTQQPTAFLHPLSEAKASKSIFGEESTSTVAINNISFGLTSNSTQNSSNSDESNLNSKDNSPKNTEVNKLSLCDIKPAKSNIFESFCPKKYWCYLLDKY